MEELDNKNDAINAIVDEWNYELSDKKISAAQNTILNDLNRLTHQIDRNRAEMGQRKRAIVNTHARIESLAKYV